MESSIWRWFLSRHGYVWTNTPSSIRWKSASALTFFPFDLSNMWRNNINNPHSKQLECNFASNALDTVNIYIYIYIYIYILSLCVCTICFRSHHLLQVCAIVSTRATAALVLANILWDAEFAWCCRVHCRFNNINSGQCGNAWIMVAKLSCA